MGRDALSSTAVSNLALLLIFRICTVEGLVLTSPRYTQHCSSILGKDARLSSSTASFGLRLVYAKGRPLQHGHGRRKGRVTCEAARATGENDERLRPNKSGAEVSTTPVVMEQEYFPGAGASATAIDLEMNESTAQSRHDSGKEGHDASDLDSTEPTVAPATIDGAFNHLLKGRDGDDEGWGGATEAEQIVKNMAEKIVTEGTGPLGVDVVPVKRRADGHLDIDGQGLLNLCILVCTGLWAVHSVVTVDATSWRGWTLQETMMRLPWDNWDSYESGLQEHPILTKTAINVGIYLIGDWLSQVNWGREEGVPLWEFDLQRTLRNGLIGAFFGPLVHYYYDFSDWILPPNVGTNRPLKIMLDQSVYFVSKCAMYISLVSLLRGDSIEETQDTLKERLKGVVTTGWRFWPFVHIFTYFLIPPRHRVLWVNCVDLLWSSILASMTSGTTVPEDDVSAEEANEDAAVANNEKAATASGAGQA